uniref:Uncharacterized protein n=1 Tax=Cannabis sativa TaxID=3483 RepID=A0A803PSN2_CANSA
DKALPSDTENPRRDGKRTLQSGSLEVEKFLNQMWLGDADLFNLKRWGNEVETSNFEFFAKLPDILTSVDIIL